GRQRAFAKLVDVLGLLGFAAGLPLVEWLVEDLSRDDVCRGVGVHFDESGRADVRLYLAGKFFTWTSIERILVKLGQDDAIREMTPFRRLVLNGILGATSLDSMLLGLVFSEAAPGGGALVKLDAF